MAKRRGFFAELQHQVAEAEKQRQKQLSEVYREQVAAQREAERTRKAAERAAVASARDEQREAEERRREAKRLHGEAREAEVASLNADLASKLEEIDGILTASLEVDSHIDLKALRIPNVVHPPFDPGKLAVPTPAMPEPVYPPEPVYQEPPAPGGLFGVKKKHAAAIERARAEHKHARQQWHEQTTAMRATYVAERDRRQKAEEGRRARLTAAEAKYREECRQRAAQAEARNRELDELIRDLAFDVESAIHEYVGIVLSNSVYPDAFPVSHDHEFDLTTRELQLTVTVPPPSVVPAVKEYKYAKGKDEIVSTAASLKTRKDRYASAVCQVAVRTLHEIFQADQGGKIYSIALTVRTDTISPATGNPETFPFVIAAADRETFRRFNLSDTNVVPQETLLYLGAAVSKSPFDLKRADTSRGVRVRGQ